MPLSFDEGRIPDSWAERIGSSAAGSAAGASTSRSLSIALINNMPDPALEDTELQFFELLDSAAGNTSIHVKLYSLPELPRSERGQQQLNNFYSDIRELWNSHLDGVIITGTEPRQPDLRDEPYWGALVQTLGWAEDNTTSTILSCLAAHASVLHSDGIPRHRLSDKRFGVFDHQRVCEHGLTKGTADSVPIPQSRWNEVREDALISSGYSVLTKSIDGAPEMFVKKKKKSLFVHFQGHPEYGTRSLLKEYRRDIRRFLSRERETYPTMPHGYFHATAARLLNNFRASALMNPQMELLDVFPETAVADTLQNNWNPPAARMYRNWLEYLGSAKDAPGEHPAMVRATRD